MIEHDPIGLKLAENTEEAFWAERERECKAALDILARETKVNEALMEKIQERKNDAIKANS